MRRNLIREHVWVSRHLSRDDYASLPIRERAEYQLAAQQHREATTPQWPLGGSED